MSRVVVALVLSAVAGAAFAVPVVAQKSPTPAAARLNACTIMSREEVKKIVPWSAQADAEKETEMPVSDGSACIYPSVHIFVGKYSAARIDRARKDGPLIPTPGIGDEAFLQQKNKYWAELYIKAGDRLVHVEKDIPADGTFESVKPPMIALGKAVVAKLR